MTTLQSLDIAPLDHATHLLKEGTMAKHTKQVIMDARSFYKEVGDKDQCTEAVLEIARMETLIQELNALGSEQVDKIEDLEIQLDVGTLDNGSEMFSFIIGLVATPLIGLVGYGTYHFFKY